MSTAARSAYSKSFKPLGMLFKARSPGKWSCHGRNCTTSVGPTRSSNHQVGSQLTRQLLPTFLHMCSVELIIRKSVLQGEYNVMEFSATYKVDLVPLFRCFCLCLHFASWKHTMSYFSEIFLAGSTVKFK